MEDRLKKFFKGKVVLVAGGTGSIGSELVRRILTYPVKQVRILSRDEFKQFNMQLELNKYPLGKVTFLIGDIRDKDRVFLAMEGVDIVFNAAAMKHVHLCESNPFEAVKTNVLGTQNMVEAARAVNAERFVQISTDKAALPANVMGATKLLCEKITITAERYKGSRRTIFSAVRFGNVFGSRGSVAPLFFKQIKNGGPVTLTDKQMTRFIMRIPDAVDLVLKAAVLSKGGELFILKMPVVRIEDLARAMIDVIAPRFDRDPKKIKIKEIGKRRGEKNCELLMIEEEAEDALENEEMFCLSQTAPDGFAKCTRRDYQSDKCESFSYKELIRFVKKYYDDEKY